MRLAEMITFKVGKSPINLRASLRAATNMESKYGFEQLFYACADGNLSVLADVIEISSDNRGFLKSIVDIPLIEVMPPLLENLPSHILALAGVDPDKKVESQGGASIPFAEYHAKLFRIGTGWLGWSPEQTWNATPSEILEAYSGHLEMLRAVHGGAEAEQSNPAAPDNAAFDRKGLHGLKSLSGVA